MNQLDKACPRCNGRLLQVSDPEYGYCLSHGEVYIGGPPFCITAGRNQEMRKENVRVTKR